MLVKERPRPTRAKLALWAAGGTLAGFARYHGTSLSWVKRVLDGRESPPERFREDLAAYLEISVAKVNELLGDAR